MPNIVCVCVSVAISYIRNIHKLQLTVNNVHLYTTGICVARFTFIDPGVARYGFLDHQTTRRFGSFFRNKTDTTARRIEIDNLVKKSQNICIFI